MDIKQRLKSLVNQFVIGMLPIFLFTVLSVTLNGNMVDYSSRFTAILIAGSAVYVLALLVSLCGVIRSFNGHAIMDFIKENKVMLIVLVVIILTRLPFINLLQRWDAGEYYYRMGLTLDNFSYSTFEEFFSDYGLCGHSASFFCLLYMIGEFIFPRQIIGVSVINLIITAVAMWCVYKIIIKITNASKNMCAVYTLLVSGAPLVYTFTTHLNLDYTMAMIVIMIVCCYMYDKPLLVGILSIYCFQTKENGLVIVAGIALGQIVRHILVDKKKCLKKIFTDAKLYMTLAAALIQWGYFRRYGNNWVATGEQEAGGLFKWNNNGSECLGFNPSFMLMKFKQQFILNFNWIVIAVIVAGTIYIVINRKYLKDICKEKMFAICTLAGAWITHSAFSYLYITGTCSRYNIISDVIIYILAVYVIEKAKDVYLNKAEITGKTQNLKRRTLCGRILLCAWIVILALECFITIDPLSRLVFKKADGVTMDTLLMTRVLETTTYGESLIHNTQYHCYDESMDNLLKETDYDPDTTDIILYNDGGVFICGNVPLYYLNWDRQKKKRVFYENDNTEQMKDYYRLEWFEKKKPGDTETKELKDKAVFVVCTYFVDIDVDMDSAVEQLRRFYDVSERKTASTFQGGIYYYELTLKK